MIRDFDAAPDRRWTTHVRVLTYEATAMPDPEVRALARQDLCIDRLGVTAGAPVARRFATAADDPGRGLSPCTPATLAQTVWSPRPPAVLAGYGGGVWDALGPTLTRGIARVDVAKICRLVWPDGPVDDPLRMADWARVDLARRPCAGGAADRLLVRVRAISGLLAAALRVAGGALAEAAGELNATERRLGDVLGNFAGDRRLEAMVRLSAAPAPPLGEAPGPWDEPEVWFALAGEELTWTAASPDASDWTRAAASAERARRAARDQALLEPRRLLRRPAPG